MSWDKDSLEPFEIQGVFLDEINYFNLMEYQYKFKISPDKLPTVQIAICDHSNNENCEKVNNSCTAIVDSGAMQNFIWKGLIDELKLTPFRVDRLGRTRYKCAIKITDTWFSGVEFLIDDRLNETYQVLIGCQFLSQWKCVFEYNGSEGEWSLTITG